MKTKCCPYDSAEKFYNANNSTIANTLASIEPLANPITAKKPGLA